MSEVLLLVIPAAGASKPGHPRYPPVCALGEEEERQAMCKVAGGRVSCCDRRLAGATVSGGPHRFV